MLTRSANVFVCTEEQAAEIAELANLRCETDLTGSRYSLWQDRATGGGGCRIVWSHGVAWVSRHSGYPQADITEEVCFWFEKVLCCKPYHDPGQNLNPNIYGFRHWKRNERGEYILPPRSPYDY